MPPPPLKTAQEAWESISSTVDFICGTTARSVSFKEYMECYTEIQNYCAHANNQQQVVTTGLNSGAKGVGINGGEIYYLLKAHLTKHLTGIYKSSLQYSDESLLNYYAQQWGTFVESARILHSLFMYLNRMWIKRNVEESEPNVADINTTCLMLWNDCFFMPIHERYSLMSQLIEKVLILYRLIPCLLAVILRDRKGETINHSLIQKITNSFVTFGIDQSNTKGSSLEVYQKYFQNDFITATEAFYKSESESFIGVNPVTEYMKKAEIWLAAEEKRVGLYLHSSTHSSLIKTCEKVLLTDHASLMHDHFQNLLERDKLEDLSRMFRLLYRVPENLGRLRDLFENFVKEEGLSAVRKAVSAAEASSQPGGGSGIATPQEEESGQKKRPQAASSDIDPAVYMQVLLSVHNKFFDVAKTAFNGDAGLVASLDKGCREYVNRNAACKTGSSRSSELLAKYCDGLLRKSSKMTEDSETDTLLSGVMTIFKFIEDKDVFQKFYSKNLAKRLVNGNSASDDAEASVISQLKEACGFEYTTKLQRMFTDMSVSKDLNEDFKEKMKTSHGDEPDPIDFSALVLGSSAWPLTAPTTPFNIPEDLLKPHERFVNYYQSKHSGRKLNWLIQLCKGDLKTNYLKMKYTFQVSTYQMGILLPYNNATSISFDDFLKSTGMTPEALQPQLSLLCKAKVIIEKEGKVYDLNMDFKSKKIKINLNIAIKADTKAEIDETHKTIEKDRELVIQAAIVRIMKTRKAMKHVQLMQEVIAQLQSRFKPRVPDIKKCIDILLEKEYMERMEDDATMYSYVA